MTERHVTLRVAPRDLRATGALDAYLDADARKSRSRLPGPMAEEAIRAFNEAVRKLTDRCAAFVAGEDRQVSHLVLGKVQSGKTAHLLGSLAWAADSSVGAAVVFTGVTGSLNDQTHARLESDLAALPGNPVKVLHVPTVRNKRAFAVFLEDFLRLAQARGGVADSGEPLPVLVTMKNRARATAVKVAFAKLSEVAGVSSLILAIDDESDQASQNAMSRQRKIAATYKAFAEVSSLPLRNIWLSYTATPQAVLLTDRYGKLRPDFVAVVPPRYGYFGISNAMSAPFANNLVEVDDWRVRASQQTSCPQSLTDAIWRFFFVAWVRQRFPQYFYADAVVPIDSVKRLSSTQMLIHESGMHNDHTRMYRLVHDEWAGLCRLAERFVNGSLGVEERAAYLDSFAEVAGGLDLGGAQATSLLTEFASPEGHSALLGVLRDCKIMVVNSDSTGPTADDPRPVDDDDYSKHATWILIGGDILGRGITIPQLVVSYFLRSSQTPNFDTVLQQLRFCGYRRDYQKWISIHAPKQSFEDLKHMEIVDRAVWERAATWDRDELRIVGDTMPRVFYASPTGARFEPTRSSVRDPDISDRMIGTDYIFSLREIFEPRDLRANLALLKRWKAESGMVENDIDNRWHRFDDVPTKDLTRLMNAWSGSDAECGRLEAVSELFDPALQELGLAQVPTVTFVSRLLVETWSDPALLLPRLDEIQVTRAAGPGVAGTSISEWNEAYREQRYLEPGRRAILKTPHIGGGQRALKYVVHYDAVIFLVEPILALGETRNRSSALAAGIGFAALSPGGFEVRTIGHA